METAPRQISKVGRIGPGGEEGVGILRGQPHGKTPRAALPRQRTQQTRLAFLRQKQVRFIDKENALQRLHAVLNGKGLVHTLHQKVKNQRHCQTFGDGVVAKFLEVNHQRGLQPFVRRDRILRGSKQVEIHDFLN